MSEEPFESRFIEEISVGMRASYARTITETDIVLFSGVTGDDNPLHINHTYAEKTRFKGPIAHGLLVAGLISTVLGTKLPGYGALYVSQTLNFLGPVKIGDTVVAIAEVKNVDLENRRVTLSTECCVGSERVIVGEAVMSLKRRK